MSSDHRDPLVLEPELKLKVEDAQFRFSCGLAEFRAFAVKFRNMASYSGGSQFKDLVSLTVFRLQTGLDWAAHEHKSRAFFEFENIHPQHQKTIQQMTAFKAERSLMEDREMHLVDSLQGFMDFGARSLSS